VADHDWTTEFGAAITVCDKDGTVLEINQCSARTFSRDSDASLVGGNLLDCHPEPARSKVRHLLQTQGTNVYTIEKKGHKKLIYQAPWYKDGEYAGMVEISLPIPSDMPHFVRESK
jgi:transcriptional regulator with PAS, ATPase and Fis domain